MTEYQKMLNEQLGIADEYAGRIVVVTEKLINDSVALTDAYAYIKEKYGTLSPEVELTDNLSVFDYTGFKRQYEGLTIVSFKLTMTDRFEDDLVLPMSSFQIRMKHPYGSTGWQADTYDNVTVYVPGLDYAEEIQARTGPQIKIEIIHTYRGNEILRETLTETNYGQLQVNTYQGPKSASMELRGVQRIKIWDLAEGGAIAGSVTVENPTYKALNNGRVEYRFGLIDPYLKAGWTATVGDDDPFHVGSVTLNVSPTSISVVVQEVDQD